MSNLKIHTFLAFAVAVLILSCKKNSDPAPDQDQLKDVWEYTKEWLRDSTGNSYYLVATHDKKLQVRVKNSAGDILFEEYLATIDSTEIPAKIGSNVGMFLTAPNPYISPKDASLSIGLSNIQSTGDTSQLQLIANIDLETGKIYEKKYKPKNDEDLTYIENGYSVVQWYQNTILVREITKKELADGGFMGLDRSRGTRLVCYERDFTLRYEKNIDVAAASYPSNRATFIPINNNERISFGGNLGLITRYAILVSQEDLWRNVQPIVWQVDLKTSENLSQTDVVRVTHCDIKGYSVFATYEVYDSSGKFIKKNNGEWDVRNGFPLKKINP